MCGPSSHAWIPVVLHVLICGSVAWAVPLGDHQSLHKKSPDDGEPATIRQGEYHHFRSRPDILAPRWEIVNYDKAALSPGYWFVAPYEELGQKQRGEPWVGPYIYDSEGELVWSGVPLFDSFNIFDFRPATINGENMFTAIYKRADAGVIVDNSYEIKKMVQWPGGYDAANMHEFTVFDEAGKALMLTAEHHYLDREKSRQLGYDGNCLVNTNGLLELDITVDPPKTLFNWSWIDHMEVDEITYPSTPRPQRMCQKGWDANHCNAIDRFANGDFLLSCRYTDALYRISRQDGSVLWRLGGTESDFKLLGEAKFSRQHHARVREQNKTHTIISLFDNARAEGVATATHEFTRGLILSLHDGVAEVVAEYPRPDHEYSTSRGSLEVMPNGNVFMGWTFHSRISEYTPNGKLLMEAKLPEKKNTYRSYKAPWFGQPTAPPDLWSQAAGMNLSHTDVFVSWNGATEVVKWHIHQSNPAGEKVKYIQSAKKTGFETYVRLEGWVHYVVAEAVDVGGRSLGQSKVVQTVPPNRRPKIFVDEQQWLADHGLSDTGDDKAATTQSQPHTKSAITSTLNYLSQWPEFLAYVGGIFSCMLVIALVWIVYCVKSRNSRRRRVKYAPIGKEADAEDFELEDNFKDDIEGAASEEDSGHQTNGRTHNSAG